MSIDADPPRDIIEFATGRKFLYDRDYSVPQIACLKALYGLKMTDEEMGAFLAMHEGEPPKRGGYDEASFGFGRRSGKGEKLGATVIAYECFIFDEALLSPGETAYGICVAENEKQAMIVRSYVEAKFRILEQRGFEVFERREAQSKSVTAEVIRLANSVHVACFPCKKAALRGVTSIVIVFDEYGHWQTLPDAYNADIEIYRAARPTRATMQARGLRVPLLKESTPYEESGDFHNDWKTRHGSPQLVLHEVPTRFLNPTITAEYLAKEQMRDPDSYDREYLAKWGTGTTSKPFTRQMVENCTDKGRLIEPPQTLGQYTARLDAGFMIDPFPLAIGRLDGDKVVIARLDIWKPKPGHPLDDKEVVAEIALILKGYGIDSVGGDQFCQVPIRTELARHNIKFRECPATAETKAKEFKNLVAVMNAGSLRLPDDEQIALELTGLRRRGQAAAAPGQANKHDDIYAVIRGVVYELLPMVEMTDISLANVGAVKDRDRLFAERGFEPPGSQPGEENWMPRNFMNERF